MKSLLGTLATGLGFACMATVMFQFVIVGMLWSKGVFSDERWMGMMASLHGIKTADATAESKDAEGKPNLSEQPSLDELAKKRIAISLDYDLRETTLDKSLRDLRSLETQIKNDRRWLDQWKESNRALLARVESTKVDEALQEVQRTFESISPKQAKIQILKMLDDSSKVENDQAMRDIVRMLKAMSLEKRKKILGEFKSPDEEDKLAEILREIRLGAPDIDEIRESRNKLEQQLAPKR